MTGAIVALLTASQTSCFPMCHEDEVSLSADVAIDLQFQSDSQGVTSTILLTSEIAGRNSGGAINLLISHARHRMIDLTVITIIS